ncbi:MAG: hypothetical protein HPY87_08840 [Fervidobacterium sp.]|uniref:hypothetical protein n=1 Tax=Fervidobacterium sp. TaxID=1871331 RepID=UPI0025C645EA|nr:hypothetical protein [Fervidobacterium sp.]NPU89966.1 hypothetical protein [Fervidobacterium sp.]
MKKISLFFSDFHCGSSVGLMPKMDYRRGNGGIYNPSHAQNIITDIFYECINKFNDIIDKNTKGKKRPKIILNLVGDLCDGGNHHGSTQFVISRLSEQRRIAIACVKYLIESLNMKPGYDAVIFYSGTPSHSGDLCESEEVVARSFQDYVIPAIKPSSSNDGKLTHNHLRYNTNGQIFDVKHRGATPGSRAWIRENSLLWTIKSLHIEEILNSKEPTSWYIRAHNHQFTRAIYGNGNKQITGIILPSFQLATTYVYHMSRDIDTRFGSYGAFGVIVDDDGNATEIFSHISIDKDDIAIAL